MDRYKIFFKASHYNYGLHILTGSLGCCRGSSNPDAYSNGSPVLCLFFIVEERGLLLGLAERRVDIGIFQCCKPSMNNLPITL